MGHPLRTAPADQVPESALKMVPEKQVSPVIDGESTDGNDYDCGSCGFLLVARMRPGQMQRRWVEGQQVWIVCPQCGAMNDAMV